MPKAPWVVLLVSSTALARPHTDANGNLIRDAHSCGTTTIRQPVPGAALFSAPGTTVRTIYLNKNGGTYNVTNGMTDAATNTANVIASGDGAAHMNAVIPPIDANFDWNYIVQCVKAQYKPYDVIITETEPTSGNYVEAVVGGDGASTGWSASSGILGVASADNFCGVTEKGIAFSFAHNHIGIAKPNDELCATVAHEVGHLLVARARDLDARHDVVRAVRDRGHEELHECELAVRHRRAGHQRLQLHDDRHRSGHELRVAADPVRRPAPDRDEPADARRDDARATT